MMKAGHIDFSPLGHGMAAILVQMIFGFLFGMWIAGGLVGSVWFIAREHTQAEYRWIALFGSGHRENMPWYGGFELRVWDWGSVLDCVVPPLLCILLWFTAS